MAGHWYDNKGNPVYQVPRATGKGLRETTLADARKLNLTPSVTTVMQEAASPGLLMYFQDQVMDAVLKIHHKPTIEEGSINIKAWKQAVLFESKQHAAIAAEKGNEIHDSLEHAFCGGLVQKLEFTTPVINFLKDTFRTSLWIPEKSFSHKAGFGGKVDLHSETVIIDFKTKPDKAFEGDKLSQYDNHYMQLAAYRLGLKLPSAECYNLFISHETPGKFKLLPEVWDEKEELNIQKGEKMFLSLLSYWQAKTGYNSGLGSSNE